MRVGTLLLAAGASSRLGEPKQLLAHAGEPLVRYVARQALALEAGPVVAVLGAHHERIRPALAGLPLQIVVNAAWADGMAGSLRLGLTELLTEPIDAGLVLLSDQPHVSTQLLHQLLRVAGQTGRGIVASRYANNVVGVPALFSRRYFNELRNLTGDAGARPLIRHYVADRAEVAFPLGTIDLDTPADVAAWQQRSEPPGGGYDR